MFPTLLCAVVVSFASGVQDTTDVYKVTVVRATPGQLTELIAFYNEQSAVHLAAGEARPWIIRHSQGDHWDLMLVQPVGTLSRYFGEDRASRWMRAVEQTGSTTRAVASREQQLVAWKEETFFDGPAVGLWRDRFDAAGYFHIEMFVALPGKADELLRQRQMENDYLEGIGKKSNAVFTKRAGGAWDSMTIGLYRDLKHFAEDGTANAAESERIARAAGFESRGSIGTYLRSLIARHNDTLGTAVR